MKIYFIKLIILFFIVPIFLYSQSKEDNDKTINKLNELINNQNETLESMSNSLPSIGNFFESLMSMGEKINNLEKKRSEIITNQNTKLEKKIDEVIMLFESKNFLRAKIKAMTIKWTEIGHTSIDEERSEHYDNIRSEILELIETEMS